MPLPAELLRDNEDLRASAHRAIELCIAVSEMTGDTEEERACKLQHVEPLCLAVVLHLQNWIAHADRIDAASEGGARP